MKVSIESPRIVEQRKIIAKTDVSNEEKEALLLLSAKGKIILYDDHSMNVLVNSHLKQQHQTQSILNYEGYFNSKLEIVCIEDQDINAKILSKKIKFNHINPKNYSSVEECVDKITNKTNIVLLDWDYNLHFNGGDVVDKIRERYGAKVQIFLMTSHDIFERSTNCDGVLICQKNKNDFKLEAENLFLKKQELRLNEEAYTTVPVSHVRRNDFFSRNMLYFARLLCKCGIKVSPQVN